MSTALTEAASATAIAVAEVDMAKEPAIPATSAVDTTTAPSSKWPWWATLIVAGGLLVVVFTFQVGLWFYIGSTAEPLELEDVDQLQAITDDVQGIAVLILGAIFGVGATQGLAAGAAKAAEANERAAREAGKTANENFNVANNNLARAEGFEKATKELATAISVYTQKRQGDASGFVPSLAGVSTANGVYALDQRKVLSHDPDLDQMADHAQRILQRIRE